MIFAAPPMRGPRSGSPRSERPTLPCALNCRNARSAWKTPETASEPKKKAVGTCFPLMAAARPSAKNTPKRSRDKERRPGGEKKECAAQHDGARQRADDAREPPCLLHGQEREKKQDGDVARVKKKRLVLVEPGRHEAEERPRAERYRKNGQDGSRFQ